MSDVTSRRPKVTKISKEATQEKGHCSCLEQASALSYHGQALAFTCALRLRFLQGQRYRGTNPPAIQLAKKRVKIKTSPKHLRLLACFAPLLLRPSGSVVPSDPNKTIDNSNTNKKRIRSRPQAPRHTAQTVPAHSSTQVQLCPEI